MKTVRHILFSSFLLLLTAPATATDLASLTEICDSCHGVDGASQWSDMPTVAGIDEFVQSEALLAYQDDARPCATSEFRSGDTSQPATDMCAIARDLGDDDIEAISAHYAALPFVAAAQEFDADLAAAGKALHDSKCALCHTDGGSNPADEASILAGQWAGYLQRSFTEYRSGEREQPPMMQMLLDQLSDDDVLALVNYYASQQ